MENYTSSIKRKKILKICFIAIASIILIGGAGYGTVKILRTVKAPTLSSDTQSQNTPTQTATPPTVSPEKAQQIADSAYEAGNKKVTDGDQKAALIDYRTAYENYKIAQNPARADDTQFIIKSIEAVVTVPANPVNTDGVKASSKE